MSSAGHVLDMIRRMKQNRAMMKQARKRLNDVKKLQHEQVADKRVLSPLFEDKLSKEEREEQNEIIRTKVHKDLAYDWLITAVVVLVVFYLIQKIWLYTN